MIKLALSDRDTLLRSKTGEGLKMESLAKIGFLAYTESRAKELGKLLDGTKFELSTLVEIRILWNTETRETAKKYGF